MIIPVRDTYLRANDRIALIRVGPTARNIYAFLRASASFEIAILKVVFFWMKAVGLYFISAIFALLVSLVISFCAVRAWAGPDDDSPALGIMAILLFVGISSLIIPLLLGLIAELMEHKVLARRFSWLRSLRRVLLALPIGVGPLVCMVGSCGASRRTPDPHTGRRI